MEPSKAVKEYKEELVKSQKQNERLTALVGKVTVENDCLAICTRVLSFCNNSSTNFVLNVEVYLVRFLLIFLLQDNQLLLPSIEIVHPETSQSAVAIVNLMSQICDSIVEISELVLVFLCNRQIRPITGLSVQIHELPADQRRTENVKYGYVTKYKTPTS
jgi:cadmium resistance protein CadD (predicted permease)